MAAESLENLTRLYNSRGPDGLSRLDRERLANYKRTEYLFDKFLKNRHTKAKLQLTHEHILGNSASSHQIAIEAHSLTVSVVCLKIWAI